MDVEPRRPERTSIAVYVCTYRRNEPLRRVLTALVAAATEVAPSAAVGVVVIDDNADGSARPVVESFDGGFELGLHYRNTASGNISTARNAGLDAAMAIGDWVAMTDDDCEPSPGWLDALLRTQARTGAGCVTGPLEMRVPPGSPRWLTEQPFLDSGNMHHPDETPMPVAATHNSMIRSAFLRDHPGIRFQPSLGVLGGEDMVFFRQAREAGLDIRFSADAVVAAIEPPERTTFRYQLRTQLWLGNTEYVTNIAGGLASRGRLFVRGLNYLRRALLRSFLRMSRRERAQWRFSLASVCHAIGVLVGPLGVRVRHH